MMSTRQARAQILRGDGPPVPTLGELLRRKFAQDACDCARRAATAVDADAAIRAARAHATQRAHEGPRSGHRAHFCPRRLLCAVQQHGRP